MMSHLMMKTFMRASSRLVLLLPVLVFLEACSPPSEDAREELRRRGIDAHQSSFNKIVVAGDVEAVDLLLRARIKPRRGLRLAAKSGQCEVLDRLIPEYRTEGILAAEALAWSLWLGHEECIRLLREDGVQLGATSRVGENSLTKAALEGNVRFLDILIAVGVDPNDTNRNGKPALIQAVEAGQPESIRKLLALGADVDATDLNGWSALTYAARDGRNKLVRLLVDTGADTDQKTKTGWTPLTFAVLNGHRNLVRTLLGAGADPNVSSEAGLTPLIRAAQRGDRRMVRALLRAGADRDLRVDGVDAAWWGKVSGHDEIARLLSAPSGTDRS